MKHFFLRFVIYWIAIGGGSALIVTCKAEDGIISTKAGFNSLVLESMAARGSVMSGEFKYKVVSYQKESSDFEWKKEGYFGYDERSNRTIHWFKQTFGKNAIDPNPWGGRPGDGIVAQTEDGLQYSGGAIFSPEMSVVFSPNARAGATRFVESANGIMEFVPFDYRAFGYAFYGDLLGNFSFDKVLTNYLAQDDEDVPELGKDKLPKSLLPAIKDARYFDFGGCVLCIEPEKDYWVTRARFALPHFKTVDGVTKQVSESVESNCTVNLDRVDGYWVPKDASYSAKESRMNFALEWISVNRPMDEVDFSSKRLVEQLGKSLHVR